MSDQKDVQPQSPPAASSATTTAAAPASTRSELGAAALTLALWLLLIDAAVETFRNGAPVRWWVAGTVATYLGLAALVLWRGGRLRDRFSWSTRASTSLFVLLGLLAATAWLPGGLTNGVAVLQQSTSMVLSAVSALAVAWAGIVLVRVKFVPLWGRAALGVLTVYGVAAFVLGIIDGAAYPALLRGGSFWQRLPYGLQGAFIGALVAVSLAIVVSAIDGLKGLREREGQTWRFKQVGALLMSVAMAMSGVTSSVDGGLLFSPRPYEVPSATTAPANGEASAAAPAPPPSFTDVVADLNQAANRLSPIAHSLEARATALGSELDAAFRFVRDQVRFETYQGILRGPELTYAGRAGNAFDRALLLAELLKRNGVETRFVTGRLERAKAEQLFARMFEPVPPLAGTRPTPAGWWAQDAESFKARVWNRARRDYEAIRGVLGSTPTANAGPGRDKLIGEIERHAWVQAKVGGTWKDLDTAFRDAEPGRAYTAADQTVEVLPQSAHQLVTVRVVTEVLEERSLRKETALEVTLPTRDLLDRQIVLFHQSVGGGGLQGGIASGISPGARVPVLWIDGEAHNGKAIDFADQQKPVRGQAPSGGGLGSLFGSGGALSSSSSQLVGEWLEFEIAFPDGQREVTRRALVDRLGAAGRVTAVVDPEKLRPLPRDAQGPTVTRELHNIWFSAGSHNVADYAEALRLLLHDPEPPVSTLAESIWPFTLGNFGFVLLSDQLILPWLNESPAIRFYADSPRIHVFTIGPDPARTDRSQMLVDLRRDHLRGVSPAGSATAEIIERTIWFGALEGALEHETGMPYVDAAGGDTSALVSTSGLLDDGSGVVLLRAGEESRGRLAADPETAARAAAALANGNVLVVPRAVLSEGPSGWWEIAPDGTTRPVLGEDLNASYRYPGGRGGGMFPPGDGRPVTRPAPRAPSPNDARPPGRPPRGWNPPGQRPPPTTGRPPRGPLGFPQAYDPIGPKGGPSRPRGYGSPRPVVRPGNPYAPRASRAQGGGNEYMMMVKMVAQEIMLMAIAYLPDLIAAGVWALTGVLIYLISAYGAQSAP